MGPGEPQKTESQILRRDPTAWSGTSRRAAPIWLVAHSIITIGYANSCLERPTVGREPTIRAANGSWIQDAFGLNQPDAATQIHSRIFSHVIFLKSLFQFQPPSPRRSGRSLSAGYFTLFQKSVGTRPATSQRNHQCLLRTPSISWRL